MLFFVSNLFCEDIKLTPKEKNWLKQNTIEIGSCNWAPVEFIENNDISGIAGEYIKYFSKHYGLKYRAKAHRWSEDLELFKKGKIDLLPAVYYTKEREKWGFFIGPYFKVKNFLYARKDSKIRSFDEIKRLAIIKSYATIPQVKKKFPNIKIIQTNSLLESIEYVLKGKADALYEAQVVVEYTLKKNLITGLKAIPQDVFPPDKVYFYINKQKPLLYEIFKKFVNSLSESQKISIVSKWLINVSGVVLSDKEKFWVQEKGKVKYGVHKEWAPIEWLNEINKQEGILRDILDLISQRTGIIIDRVALSENALLQNALNSSKIDTYATGNMQPGYNYSQILFKVPYVFVSKNLNIKSIEDLKKYKVGIFANSDLFKKIKKYRLNYVKIKNEKKLFDFLKKGKIDVAILNYYSAKYFINKLGLEGLKIKESGFNLNVKLKFSKNFDKVGISVINKGIDSITQKELNDIIDKWTNINVKIKKEINWDLIVKIGIGAGIVFLIIAVMNYRLKQLVDEKTKELSSLLDAYDTNVAAAKTDEEGKFTYLSEAFCKMTGFGKNELLGKNHSVILHPDEKENIVSIMQQIKSGTQWQGVLKHIKKDGEIFWADTIIAPEMDDKGKFIGTSQIRHDVTHKVKLEEVTKNLEKIVEEKTRDLKELYKKMMDSIKFASLIQSSLLPDKTIIDNVFEDSFVLWKPKDIVGGDIYLFEIVISEDEVVVMVIDCTGHGVPGALVTMIVKAVAKEITSYLKENKTFEVSPAWILKYFNKAIKNFIKQDSNNILNNVGFDGGIIYYDRSKQILKFAGANIPLFYIDSEKKVKMIKGDRQSVGYKECDVNYEYQEHTLLVEKGMKFYMTTDGFIDQLGGEKEYPFGKKRFMKLIESVYGYSMRDQHDLFVSALDEYRGEYEQNDDITVLGAEIGDVVVIENVFDYNGILTQAIITHALSIIESRVQNPNDVFKLSSLIIEMIQNIINYSKNKNEEAQGMLRIVKNENEYIVISKNVISKKDKAKIVASLDEVIKLDKKQIRKIYKQKMANKESLGFYAIAKSSDKIEYSFEKINKDKLFFELKVTVKSKNV